MFAEVKCVPSLFVLLEWRNLSTSHTIVSSSATQVAVFWFNVAFWAWVTKSVHHLHKASSIRLLMTRGKRFPDTSLWRGLVFWGWILNKILSSRLYVVSSYVSLSHSEGNLVLSKWHKVDQCKNIHQNWQGSYFVHMN